MNSTQIVGSLLETDDDDDDFDPQVEFDQLLASYSYACDLLPGDRVIFAPYRIPQTVESVRRVSRPGSVGEPFVAISFVYDEDRSWVTTKRTMLHDVIVKVIGNINDPS